MRTPARAINRTPPVATGLPAALAGDERLARLAGAGSERAFAVLYDRYHQRLYRYVRAMLRHDDDAQDALQSALTKAFSAPRCSRGELARSPACSSPSTVHGHGQSGRASHGHRGAVNGRRTHGSPGHRQTGHGRTGGGSNARGQNAHSRISHGHWTHSSPAQGSGTRGHGNGTTVPTHGTVPGHRSTGATGFSQVPTTVAGHHSTTAPRSSTQAGAAPRTGSSRSRSTSTVASTSTGTPAGPARKKVK